MAPGLHHANSEHQVTTQLACVERCLTTRIRGGSFCTHHAACPRGCVFGNAKPLHRKHASMQASCKGNDGQA